MTLELVFIRHGQTDYSLENRFCGSIDPPLNAVGLRMAEAFGAAYASTPWTAIYCSPRLRAHQTADALATRVNLEVVSEPGLAEIAYGEWEGQRHDDVKAASPEAYAYWSADVASRGTPSGETAFAVAARAAPVIEKIRGRHTSGRVLVVSHKATIRILVCALLGLDVRVFRDRLSHGVAAVTRFELKSNGAQLLQLGDVSHLPADLRGLDGT